MGNDIEIRVRVANQTTAGLNSIGSNLGTLRDRARSAATAMTALRTAAGDIDVRINDRTTAGITRITNAVRDLRAQSPIRLDVTFDDQSGQISDSARATQRLHTASQRASNSLTLLATTSLAATVSLQRLAAAAEDATGELRDLRTAASRAATAVGRLGQRAETTEGRLSRLRSSTAHLTIQMNELGSASRSTGGDLQNLRGSLGRLTVSAGNASNSLGGSGMGLRRQMIATAVALGATLLPTIGALSPMLFGMTAVVGGGALALDDLKKKAKELKAPFEEWRKVAEKAVAPHTEKAVKSLKGAMKDLTPVIEIGADTFGRITEKASRFADSPAFKGALLKNVQMGSAWFEDFAGSIGSFTQAFLEFGAKSQPALDAWDNLLGGFLDTGLPGMFKEMEQGIGGSSDFLNGLASLINDSVLPTLGKVAGSFTEAFGPLLKELMIGAGNAILLFGDLFSGAMETLEPAADVAADVFRGLNEIFKIGASVAGSLTRALGGALLGSISDFAGQGGKVDGLRGSFTRLSDWVKENQATIRLAFTGMALAMIDMVNLGVQSVPLLVGAFRGMTEMVLGSVELLIDGLAGAFGDLPVVGDMFKDAQSQFDKYAGGFREKLEEMQKSSQDFADVTGENLSRAQVVVRVDQAEASLEYIKQQLEDPNLTKERRAKLTADKKEAERELKAAERQLAGFDGKKATGKIIADPSQYRNALGAVNRSKVKSKSGIIKADTSFFRNAVAAISGSVVGNAYINVHYSYKGGKRSDGASFMGPSGRYAEGGVVEGPGTDTSDSVPILASRDEYIVNAKASRKHRRLLEAINNDELPRFAKGGKVSKQARAEAEARRGAMGDLTISHFGRMAGYKTSEIIGQLGRADSLHSLVNSLNQWRSIIMKSTHGGQEKTLLKALDSAGKKLLGWEKQLTSVTKSLEKARDKLDSLKAAASQLSDSVKGGVLSSANITRGVSGDRPTTVASIMGGLTASRDKATAFSKALADLEKKGLSGALIQQIAEANIEGGGLETAGALLGASSSEIKSMNDLQSQITSAAGSAGKTTADSVFGAQIKAQQAYVTTLAKSQGQLTKAMEKLAKSIEKSIEKAFGKKAAGGIVGAAASGGARGSWTLVGEHEPELVRLPFGSRVYSGPDTRRMQQQAWASMLNEPRRGAARSTVPAAAAAGDGQPLVIQLRLHDRDFGEVWVDVGRKEVRARGGLEATLRPPRGR